MTAPTLTSPAIADSMPLAHLTHCHRILDDSIHTMQRLLDWTNGGVLEPLDEIDVRTALTRLDTVSELHRQDEEASLFPRLCEDGRPEAVRVKWAIDWVRAENRDAEKLLADVNSLMRVWLEERSLRFTDTWRLRTYLSDLRKLYRNHALIEESQVFPVAEQFLDDCGMRTVAIEMLTRRGFRE